ncbi:unnamed protein product [Callosobruchus maculatus]|uniref:Uncharacterized protein n=1 Tax=Callosobruchus maculatus TaxID=64391 RepID=A0A653DD69_CALMS|nr:unnamed protein product [Callosobruchus maculatus]
MQFLLKIVTWKGIAYTIAVGSIVYGLKKYFGGGVCYCTARLDGQVVVITGGNSGIGKALAVELVNRGATIVLACRNIEKGLEAKKHILSKNRKAKIFVKHLDLCSFSSIVKFCDTLNLEFNEIYGLVNNAGIFYHPYGITEDGFEVTLQTNYLGPFILTHHLLKPLKQSIHARIINVASDEHRRVSINQLIAISRTQKDFKGHFVNYGASKLALVLFTKELAKKLQNTNVIVNAVDPGNVETAIYRNFYPLSNPVLYALQWIIRVVLVKTPTEGCQTLLHALLTPNRTTGQYYADCKLALPSPVAADERICREYYQLTLEVLASWFSTESEC